MDRSSGFGSTPSNYRALFGLGFPAPTLSLKLATECKSLTHYTKGTQSPLLQTPSGCFRRADYNAARCSHLLHSFLTLLSRIAARYSSKESQRRLKQGLPLFVCMRFQVLFHSPSGVLFAFPSRYWFTIGRLRVFSLGGWSPHVQTGFLVSRPTCSNPISTPEFSRTGLSPTMARLSRLFH